MKIGVNYVVASTASGEQANQTNYQWIKELGEKVGQSLDIIEGSNFADYDVVFNFIGSGGTEGLFVQQIDQLKEPVLLLTTGAFNSLAASMEILSYLRQNNIQGEIIHGDDDFIVNRMKTLLTVLAAKERISHFRFARVGKPSDWLISSDVDAEEAETMTGIELIDIPMEEFFAEIEKNTYEENEYTQMIRAKGYKEEEVNKALAIYGALDRLVQTYALDGLTVRCFDLLDTVHSTGCLALAVLNAKGIYASCEGDVPALISMAILGELTKEPVFMANPSKIDTANNEIIFAHCTLPISMPNDFSIMTHYESNIGVAFRGHIQEGPVTVFKTDGLMMQYFVSEGELLENLTRNNLCRTQIRLHLDESVQYFLKESIGNHHLIVKGHYGQLIEEFFTYL